MTIFRQTAEKVPRELHVVNFCRTPSLRSRFEECHVSFHISRYASIYLAESAPQCQTKDSRSSDAVPLLFLLAACSGPVEA